MKAELPYWAGGVILGLGNAALFAVNGKPWTITAMLTNMAARLAGWAGLAPATWDYFGADAYGPALARPWWQDPDVWVNLGIVLGVVTSAAVAREFRWKWPRWRQALPALAGGLLMGYGARLAAGCTAGAVLGGIPSLSLHGWVFAALVLLGVFIGLRLFHRAP